MLRPPEFICPKCGGKAYLVRRTSYRCKEFPFGRAVIVCGHNHISTVDPPEDWKPERMRLRPRRRAF